MIDQHTAEVIARAVKEALIAEKAQVRRSVVKSPVVVALTSVIATLLAAAVIWSVGNVGAAERWDIDAIMNRLDTIEQKVDELHDGAAGRETRIQLAERRLTLLEDTFSDFIDQGPRFTREDGDDLEERIRALETRGS